MVASLDRIQQTKRTKIHFRFTEFSKFRQVTVLYPECMKKFWFENWKRFSPKRCQMKCRVSCPPRFLRPWLGNRLMLVCDLVLGVGSGWLVLLSVDPDPLTSRALPVPFKHQFGKNWWNDLLRGGMVGAYFNSVSLCVIVMFVCANIANCDWMRAIRFRLHCLHQVSHFQISPISYPGSLLGPRVTLGTRLRSLLSRTCNEQQCLLWFNLGYK